MIKEITYNEVFDAQEHFRLILDAMARPASIHQFNEVQITPPASIHTSSAYVALALMNRDVTCCVATENVEEIETYLRTNTGVRFADAETASFLFCDYTTPLALIEESTVGNPLYPEEGAFILLQVEELSKSPLNDAVRVTLSGPGIKDEETIYIKGVSEDLLETIWEKNQEYPLGVELILCDSKGQVSCVPRTSKVK